MSQANGLPAGFPWTDDVEEELLEVNRPWVGTVEEPFIEVEQGFEMFFWRYRAMWW